MKKILFSCLTMIMIVSLFSCTKLDEKIGVINYQLVQNDGTKSKLMTIKNKRDVKKVRRIIQNIKWTGGIPKFARYPDVEFWLEIENEKIGIKYEFWFSKKNSTFFSEAKGLGKISNKDAKLLAKILLEE